MRLPSRVLFWFWIGLVVAPSAEAGRPRYADPNALGPFGVGHTVVELVDASRARTLRTEIWYPVDPENADGDATFYDFSFLGLGLESPVAIEDAPVTATAWLPLVIFSHGYGGVSWQSTPLVEMLASHGMVVVAPNHTGNTLNDIGGPGQAPFDAVVRDRPRDVSFLIDQLLARSFDPDDEFYARIDPNRIGVAGHSFGGFTAIAMASGIQRDDLDVDVAPDPRVRAIAAIAPASFPFSDAELASIEIPTLLLAATSDDTTPVVPNVTRPWELIASRPLYRADVIGAEHEHFAQICDIAQALLDFGVSESGVAMLLARFGADYESICGATAFPIAEARRIANLYVTAFFKQVLWFDGRYDPFLTPAYATANEPAVAFQRKDPSPP